MTSFKEELFPLRLSRDGTPLLLPKVSRVEIIRPGKGREFMLWDERIQVELSLQDGGRTLKIFYKCDEDLPSKELKTFIQRLNKIGIKVHFVLNLPWVYLDQVNDKKVEEKRNSEHGYTIAFFPITYGDHKIKWLDLKETFQTIRKYRTS